MKAWGTAPSSETHGIPIEKRQRRRCSLSGMADGGHEFLGALTGLQDQPNPIRGNGRCVGGYVLWRLAHIAEQRVERATSERAHDGSPGKIDRTDALVGAGVNERPRVLHDLGHLLA